MLLHRYELDLLFQLPQLLTYTNSTENHSAGLQTAQLAEHTISATLDFTTVARNTTKVKLKFEY